ncbi:MAG: glycosyltransferase family 1 protein [bacterium]|nr:glycosyltransferase family 1 protein [bacterium]
MISIGFIYKPSNPYLCGLRPNNNFGKFYLEALKRNPDVEVTYYGSDGELDCRKLGKHDVYLFFETTDWGVPYLYNIDALKGLKVASIGDAHSCNRLSTPHNRTRKQLLFDMRIDYCYYQHTPNYFHKFYPKFDNYWWIPIGFDAELYKDVKPWKERRGDKVLLTGLLGSEYYGFREKCKKHPLVKYVPPGNYEKRRYKKGKYDGDNYKKLLEQFKFCIASGYTVANKYFEIPAAGSVCVSHTDKDNGCDIIGFDDFENTVMVQNVNVNSVLDMLVERQKDSRWEKIAQRGYEFIYANYTHEKCVERLVSHIKEVV